MSDKESPESAPEQFSLQATGQGYFFFALSLLPGFLTLAHPYALSPPSVHTHVHALLPSSNKFGLLHAIFCSLHFLSLLSVMRSLPSKTAIKLILGKRCDTGFGLFVFESVPLCELGRKKWHVLTFMPL